MAPAEDYVQVCNEISHAFQTPLTVLKSALELLREDRRPKERRVLQIMEQNVDELSHLTKNLLQLARIDASPEMQLVERIDLSSIVCQVVEYVEVICQHQRIIVERTITPDLMVYGDTQQLREMVTNLLSNAVKYTKPCALRKIMIVLSEERGRILLSIADTGIGIHPDRIPYIFNRFYRDHHKGTTGAGLGLTIVKRIVELHRGSITVESSIGKGTCMIVEFPSCPNDTTTTRE